MMFWLVFWLLALFVFLILPVICVEKNRDRWIRRFRERRWSVDTSQARRGVDTDTLQGADGFHYVLSKAQEEDIRECFLSEKLRNYTQELSEEQIQRPRANSRTALVEDEDTKVLDDPVDLEQGAADGKESEDPSFVTTDEAKSEAEIVKKESIDQTGTQETDPSLSDEEEKGPDNISDDASTDDELMDYLEFTGNDGHVVIPVAGECRHDQLPSGVKASTREEPNGCAICLSSFEVEDKVTWASNPDCQHVFHDACISQWLMASGRKHLKRQRREQRRTGNLSYASDPVAKIVGFPMLCPCCRQHFVAPEDEEESVDEKETMVTTPPTNEGLQADAENAV